jgi:type I restriction enzyme, S subunit
MRDEWEVARLSELVERVTERNTGDVDNVLTVSAEHGLVQQERYFTKRVASKNLTNYWRVSPGDYVFNKSYSNGYPYGVIRRNHSSNIGVVSPLYIVMRPSTPRLVDGWLDLAFESRTFTESIASHLREGGRAHGALNIRLGDFFSTRIPVPPLSVQRRVVDLIDHIDQALSSAERQLDSHLTAREQLLTTVFQQASKDSGWQPTSLGEIASLTIGKTPPRGEPRYWTDDLSNPFCTIADMSGPSIEPRREGVTDVAVTEGKARRVPAGSLLMSFKLSIGRVGFASKDVFPNEAIVWVEPTADMSKQFLAIALEMADLGSGSVSAVKGNTLNKTSLKAVALGVPSRGEQQRIVDLASHLDARTSCSQRVVESLRQLRANVLTSLLSGDHEIPESYDKFLEGRGAV